MKMGLQGEFTDAEVKNLPQMMTTFLAVLAHTAGGAIDITEEDMKAIDGYKLTFKKDIPNRRVVISAVKDNIIPFPPPPQPTEAPSPAVA